MFSLITTIIAIALVAALVLATLYYGGDAFNKGSAEANASKVINQGQQIAGAYTLYATEKRNVASGLEALVAENYLKAIPEILEVAWRPLVANKDVFWLPEAVDKDTCKAINAKLNNIAGVPGKPVVDWARQCYGENDKFYVLWNGPSGVNMGQVISSAHSNSTDTQGFNIPASLQLSGLPTGLSGADNTWTVPPLSSETDPSENNAKNLFSTSFDVISEQFSSNTITFNAKNFIENNGSPLYFVALGCNSPIDPLSGYTLYYAYPNVVGDNVSINIEHHNINQYAYPSCQSGNQEATIHFRYQDGSNKQSTYSLNFKGLDIAAQTRPSNPEVAQIYDQLESYMPASTAEMETAILNNGSAIGFRVPDSAYDNSNLTISGATVYFFKECNENDPIVQCTPEFAGTDTPYRSANGSPYTKIGLTYYNIQMYTNTYAFSLNKKGYVKLEINNTQTGEKYIVFKAFQFITSPSQLPPAWTY